MSRHRDRTIQRGLFAVVSSAVVLAALLVPSPVVAEEPLDWRTLTLIRQEGFERSQVGETLRHLTDEIGPRLTGSPAMLEANRFTRDRLTEWGLADARLEAWGPFGRGWSFTRTAVHMVTPRGTPLAALPKAWTPGTNGAVRGAALRVQLEDESDLEEWSGKLAGKILFLSEPRAPEDADGAEFHRYTPEELDKRAEYPIPSDRGRGDFRVRARKRWELSKKLNQYLVDEGVVATVDISSRDAGILRVGAGGSRVPGESTGVPALVMAAEHYNWITRLLDEKTEVEIEVEVEARFHDDDLMAYNTIAELPGTDKRDELVMVGAHLDSWHAAAGSNDNGAGVVVAMEAVRILAALGIEPRRTIRIGLWSGEEQGLLGSRAYVAQHFAERPEGDNEEIGMPRYLREETWPIDYKPAHESFQAYFNLDNGSGRIRGIYTQSNAALAPIFERWLEPFHDLGADTVSNRNAGGTDHLGFDAVALPGFQFIQDGLDYSSRTHHTDLDHFDHARIEDLKQASVIMASFVYLAAMRDEQLPRKAKPQPPAESESETSQTEPTSTPDRP